MAPATSASSGARASSGASGANLASQLITKLRNWRPDPLIVLIILAVIIAIIVPAEGSFATGFGWFTKAAIALLFFLYGARLSPQEALQGLKHWRLHSLILVFTYVAFPIIGLLLFPLQHVVGQPLYLGILFMCLVPSTVQSSVAFTNIAGGNVAGAIVSASTSNLLGVFITPVLVMLTMQGSGLHISTDVFVDVALQLLVPFILGQIARVSRTIRSIAASPATKNVDRFSIAFVVYSAFSQGIVEGIWSRVAWWQILLVAILSVALVELMLTVTWRTGKRLGFGYDDLVAIQFCGTKKSLATGLPMAAVLFPTTAAMMIIPLMIFHQLQLFICSLRASRYARELR